MTVNYPIFAVFKAKDETGSGFAAVTGKIARLKTRLQGLTAGFGQIKTGVAGVAGGVKNAVLATAGALTALGLAAGGIAALVTRFGDNAESILNASKRLGISAQEFQELKYVFEAAGIGLDTMEAATNRLTKAIFAARSGSKEAADAFQQLGLSGAEFKNKSRLDQLVLVYERLNQIRDGAGKRKADPNKADALALKLLGKSALELKPLLAQGRQELERMKKLAAAFAIPEEELAKADNAADALKPLSSLITMLGTAFAAKLGPGIERAVNAFADWAIANKDVIDERLTQFVARLSAALAQIDFGKVLGAITTLIDYLPALINNLDLLVGAFVGLQALKIGGGVLTFFAGLKAILPTLSVLGGLSAWLLPVVRVVSLIGAGLLSWPAAIAIAIVAIVALIAKWDWVKAKFQQFFPETYAILVGWVGNVKAFWSGFTNQLATDWATFTQALGGLIEAGVAAIKNAFAGVRDFVAGVFEGIKADALARLAAIGDKIRALANFKWSNLNPFVGSSPKTTTPATPSTISGGQGIANPEGNAGSDTLADRPWVLSRPVVHAQAPATPVHVVVNNAPPGSNVIVRGTNTRVQKRLGFARARSPHGI